MHQGGCGGLVPELSAAKLINACLVRPSVDLGSGGPPGEVDLDGNRFVLLLLRLRDVHSMHGRRGPAL